MISARHRQTMPAATLIDLDGENSSKSAEDVRQCCLCRSGLTSGRLVLLGTGLYT